MNSNSKQAHGMSAVTLPTIAPPLFVVYGYYTEPPEDEYCSQDDESVSVDFVVARSKSQAIRKIVKELKADDYRPLTESDPEFDEMTPKWTNEWAVVEFDAAGLDSTWSVFSKDIDFWGEHLLAWARSDLVSAQALLDAARAGQAPGQLVIANYAELISILEKDTLQGTVGVFDP